MPPAGLDERADGVVAALQRLERGVGPCSWEA